MSSDHCCFVIKSLRSGWGENFIFNKSMLNKALRGGDRIQESSFDNNIRPKAQVVMSCSSEDKQKSLNRKLSISNCWLNLSIKESSSRNSQNRNTSSKKAILNRLLIFVCLQATRVTYCDENTSSPTTIVPIYELANPKDNVNFTSYSKDDQANHQVYGLTGSQDLDGNDQYDYYTSAYITRQTQLNSEALNAVDRLELPTQVEVTHIDTPTNQVTRQKSLTDPRQMRMDYSVDQRDPNVGSRNDLTSAEAGATAALFSDGSPEEKMIDNMIDMAQSRSVVSAPSSSVSNSNNEATGGSNGSSGSSEKPSASTGSTGTQPQPQQQSGASLGDQISAVSNLLQQAGQLGLSAAQQNAALSEALINGLSNTLINAVPARLGSRRPSASASQTQHSPAATTGSRPALVGQGINGNIEYDSDNNQLNGFIEFPDIPGLGNLTNKRPNNVVKPLVLAALKTVPFKLGTVGWKILKLIVLKKLYKAHHPKSGEIMVEQEMKDSPISMSMDKSAKLGKSLKGIKSQSFKTSKMGQISPLDDDFISNTIMGSTGGSDSSIKSGGAWPSLLGGSSGSSGGFDGLLPGSSSMMYQRQLLPQNAYGYGAGHTGSAPNPPAAAAAAAAALTAAAIQSHWMQQQVANSDPDLDNSNNNTNDNNKITSNINGRQVNLANRTNSTSSGRKSKRASQSLWNNSWFSSPVQAYAAAAAAANAAAILASHQQQLMQRDRQRYEAAMAGSSPFEFASGSNINQVGDFQQALTGIMYRNFVDNTQQVKNNDKGRSSFRSYASSSGPLADYPDQSDPFYGSSVAAMSVNRDSPTIGMATSPDPTLGTLEGQWSSNGFHTGEGFGNYPYAGDGPMQMHRADTDPHQRHFELSPVMGETNPLGHHHQTGIFSFNAGQMPVMSPLGALPEFDDTPAGSRLIGVALNDNKISRLNDNKA